MLDEKILKKVIFGENMLKPQEFNAAVKDAEKKNKPLEAHLFDSNILDEDEVYTKAAKLLKYPFISLKGKEIKKDFLQMLPVAMAQAHGVIIFGKGLGSVKVAAIDPGDIITQDFIAKKTGSKVKIFLTSPGSLRDVLRRYHSQETEEETFSTFTFFQDQSEFGGESGEDLKKVAQDLPVVNIVNSILEHAYFANASDIHIEPEEKSIVVRFRVDGVLRPEMTLPKTVASGITARIKILAKLKLDEHMLPQDGRFKLKVADDQLSLRVSIMPTMNGEKIVLRLLHENTKPLTLEDLGFLPGPKELVEEAIKKPHGMILATGPTGSGKTTTLYSLMGILNKPAVNIMTIEDPIEYKIDGINQSQVNTKVGFDFANALRSFLRQDPDIIMVGEIRDEETAKIAIHAAMTGHLVLSTLHTNDAPTTLPRITEMGVPHYLVAFTANLIIAQRLVRKICEHCKKEVKLEAKVLEDILKSVNEKRLYEFFKKMKIDKAGKSFKEAVFYRGEGCGKCGQTGYKGRVGIYEVLEVDKEMQRVINEKGTAGDIKAAAVKQGMITMAEDGIIKAKMGVTTMEEIFRVTKD